MLILLTVGAFSEASISWKNSGFIEKGMKNHGEIKNRCVSF